MQRPSLPVLRAASERRQTRLRPQRTEAIDLDRPLVPEHFTQLYHTSWYQRLDHAQRLRYNQLYGLRSNELFMLFEQGFTCRVVERLRDHCLERGKRELADCLEMMLREEERHHAMFHDFNRRYFPGGYDHSASLFTPSAAQEKGWMGWLMSASLLWPTLVWLILVLEEFSTAFSRMLLRTRSAGELGPLEASYVELHRLHLMDEAGHVHLDVYVIEELLSPPGRPRERAGGWLFRRLFRELLAPKHSGARVLGQLVREFPDLALNIEPMLAEVRALGQDRGMVTLLEDPGKMPIATALLQRYPGFRWSADRA